MFITNSGWCLSPLQLSTTLTQYRGCTCLQLQGHSIPRLGWCWGSGVNKGRTLNQHCVNMWITSFCRDLQYCYSRVENPIAPGCTPQITPGYPVLQPGIKINITRGIWVKQTNKMMTRNCLTRGNLWGNATGYFSAMDVVITPG